MSYQASDADESSTFGNSGLYLSMIFVIEADASSIRNKPATKSYLLGLGDFKSIPAPIIPVWNENDPDDRVSMTGAILSCETEKRFAVYLSFDGKKKPPKSFYRWF